VDGVPPPLGAVVEPPALPPEPADPEPVSPVVPVVSVEVVSVVVSLVTAGSDGIGGGWVTAGSFVFELLSPFEKTEATTITKISRQPIATSRRRQ
jgi:hypothetical protein